MTFDEEHHRLALVAPPVALTPRTPATACMHRSAYTFDALSELLDCYAALKARGIEPLTPIQHGVTTSLYYRDPDGNLVELQVDNFASPAAATAYMMGLEFAAAPIGPAFDPQAMRDALRADAAVSVLTKRPASSASRRRWFSLCRATPLRSAAPGTLPGCVAPAKARPAVKIFSCRNTAPVLGLPANDSLLERVERETSSSCHPLIPGPVR